MKAILLNGPSSSGKSTLAHSIAGLLESELYSIISIDDYLPISLNEPIYEDDVWACIPAMCRDIADSLQKGKVTIIDHAITSERIYRAVLAAVGAHALLQVKVTCDPTIMETREKKRGDRFIGSAAASLQYLYPADGYHMTVDTGSASSEVIAARILCASGLDERDMNQLFVIDIGDYQPDARRFRRPSARGIILTADKQIAMVHSAVHGYYKFPGGGIQPDENRKTALIREVRQETGLTVLPDSITPFGSVLRLQRNDDNGLEVFEQENYYYLCSVTGEVGEQERDPYEVEAGFELQILPIDQAIRANLAYVNASQAAFHRTMALRESRILQMVKDRYNY